MNDQKEIRNIDGELIDLEKDDLLEKLTYETANLGRRLAAYVIDFLMIASLWYVMITFVFNLFGPIDAFVASLGTNEADFADLILYQEFKDLIWKLFMNLWFVWLMVNFVYYTLVPAIIGDGRSIGKMFAGIGVVDLKTLEETNPLRLILREFVGRVLCEMLFVIPWIASIIVAYVRKDARMIHDLISRTIVIKLDLYKLD